MQLAVPELSHLTQTVGQAIAESKDLDQVGASGSCNLNVRCEESLSAESRAVAKMVYNKGSGIFMCTGTLLNDSRGSRTPYFLSAAHCLSDQAAASSLVTYWFFRAGNCRGNSIDNDALYLTGGARLHFVNAQYDTILMELNGRLPQGVVFAGSYYGSALGTGMDVMGVHHPSGDLQKYSRGRLTGYGTCVLGSNTCTRGQSASNGTMLESIWYRGVTEGGSSGSALFVQDATSGTRYVVGALHGGLSNCSVPGGPDFYGRFDKAFAAGIGNLLKR